MKVKRYVVNDMNEAMIMIKNELGKDAIILSSRKVRGTGFWSFFTKSKYEVTAAVEEDQVIKNATHSMHTVGKDKKVLETYMQVKEHETVKQGELANTFNSQTDKNPDIQKINSEISELKEMMNQLVTNLTAGDAADGHSGASVKGTSIKKAVVEDQKTQSHEEDEDIKVFSGLPIEEKILRLLKEKDIDDQFAKKIADLLLYDIDSLENDMQGELRAIVSKLLGKPYTIDQLEPEKRIFFFVGPTGVGKTTTLAKLAAKLSLVDNKKVALITADTYRIAAVDQLKTYSEILGIPLSVIYEPDELESTLQKYADRDCILIDTAGRSQNSKEFKSDITELLQYVEKPEIFLVISLTTGYKEIRKILLSYDFLEDFKLLFTKLDESSSYGNVLNARMLTNKSLSYFTIGQSVPDDIEIANPERIVDYIVGD